MTMLLQHAIILGDPLKTADATTWLSDDGSCGCAFGGALLAVGVTPEEFLSDWLSFPPSEWPCVQSRWPWLTWDHMLAISGMYHDVVSGKSTIEDIADYVRTIEPAETEQSSACILDREEVLAL